jgi:putative oligomerization/nucleic acid binding protein
MGIFGKSKKEKAADLMATGSRGVGTVVSVRDTGMTVNDNPRVEMVFRVEPLDGSPTMDLTKKTTVSRVEIPRQGDRYPVWYDPQDRDLWAYATIADETGRETVRQMFGEVADTFVGMGTPAAPAGAGGQDVAAQLTQLADLKNQGLLTDEEFEAQKAKLLG